MSVAVQGSGPRTLVLMPGLGTPEPILDFAPLAQRLAEQNTVVTIENFGLGLSDGTDAPRTSEGMVNEIRSALKTPGLDGPYVLMPHSISGLYAMWWATNLPDESPPWWDSMTSVTRPSLPRAPRSGRGGCPPSRLRAVSVT